MIGVKKSATDVVTAKCEQFSVIRFLHLKGKDQVIIHQELKDVYGKNALSYVAVCKWTELFKKGCTDVHDNSRSSRQSVISEELVDTVNELTREDHRIQVREVHARFPAISLGTIYEMIRNCLGFKKLCARWVPKMLTDNHITARMGLCLQFLQRNAIEGEEFLDRIVTCDETWVSHVNPETKQQFSQWKHTMSPRTVKFKKTLTARKVMATVFWD